MQKTENWELMETVTGRMNQFVVLSEGEDDSQISLGVTFKASEENEKRAGELAQSTDKALRFINVWIDATEEAQKGFQGKSKIPFEKLLSGTREAFGKDYEKVGASVALFAADLILELEKEIARLKQRNKTLEFMIASTP